MAKVSLKRIAEQADVSVTTVSRVLRGRGEISEKTRLKVQRIADKMRYRPNLAAQGMHSGRSNTIGVIIPAAWNFDIRIAFGIHDKLAEYDVVPITLWSSSKCGRSSDEGVDNAVKQIHNLIDRRVDGCILRPQIDFKEIYINEILEREIPIVTVDRDFLGSHADFVGTDDMDGAKQAAEHLLNLGHRNFVHIAGPESVTTGRIRREAFENCISRMQDAECVTFSDESFGEKDKIAEKVFDLSPSVTAVFAANDLIARNVYNAARRTGLSIPEQLSVVGFGDLEQAEYMDPPLTTVRQQPYDIGYKAAEILLQRIENKHNAEPKTVLLKPQLIVRESTKTFKQKEG